MAKKSRLQRSPFARALKAARMLTQASAEECGSAIGVSARQVFRLEKDEVEPSAAVVEGVLAWAATIPEPYGSALAQTVRPLPPPQPGPSPNVAVARENLAAAFDALAEALDAGPRTLRRALDAYLAALQAAGVSIEDARARLARDERAARDSKR